MSTHTREQPRFVTKDEYDELVKLVIKDKASRTEVAVLRDILIQRERTRRRHERWLIGVGAIFDLMVIILAVKEFLL